MSNGRKAAEYHARQARLKWVADNIERGIDSKFYGADFHMGFNYMFGEIVELQREFNERFAVDMPGDPRFAEFYSRIVQIMESSEIVLLDSIDPAVSKKSLGELMEQNMELEKSIAETEKKIEEIATDRKKKDAEEAARDSKKNRRGTYRKGPGAATAKPGVNKK